MNVTCCGIGYIGLSQAAVLADAGRDVCCVDIDQNKIDDLNKGIIPIYEPGLTSLVESNHAEGRLTFKTDAEFGANIR